MAEINKEIREASAPNMSQTTQKRRYEIAVYQADYEQSDANGNPIARWKKVTYEQPVIIEASCKKDLDDLQKQYAMCDQKFEIIRPLDPPPSIPTNQQNNVEQIVPQQNCQTPCQTNRVQQINIQPVKSCSKPRIITIGDVQLKYDGDKIYQKQWIKLNQNEQSNIRVVNDSNNKIIDLTGKHIEAKKWVLVEQSSDNETDDDTFAIQE